MNKKGLVFTLMAIVFMIMFIFIFLLPVFKVKTNEMLIVETRVDTINNFIKDIERDTSRGLYIASYRALLSIENDIIEKGVFTDNLNSQFHEAILNGTINGQSKILMNASTFPQWISRIQDIADDLNIGTNITLHEVQLSQITPWDVLVTANLNYVIFDQSGIAYWNYNKTINTSISILGFEDPIYVIYSFGRLTNTINQTPYENNYTFENDVDNLISHTENSYYVASNTSPNFLMRLENNLSASPYGIESLINVKKLNDFGLSINTEASIVDYYYWQDYNNGDYRINGTPSWFKLDAGSLNKYMVDDLSYLE